MRKKHVRHLLMALGMSWLWGGLASADIISTTGPVDLLSSPPASVVKGALQSNTDVFAFTEQTDLKLSSNVDVNITTPGTYATDASLTPGKISAGTLVDSYFLYTDPVNPNQIYNASVTFSTPILGIIVLSDTLDKSDKTLGASGTTYPTGDPERGLELTSGQDYVTWSGDTLTIHFYTHDDIDQIRILTAVPEPNTLVVAGGVMALLACVRFCQVRRRTGS